MRILGGMALVNQTGENNMIFGNRTGMGPALRVLRHFAEREQLHKIEFQSGERALLMIAGLPVPSVELVRLALGGLVPWQTVWEYNPIRAGGYSDYIHKLKAMFSPAANRSDESVHHIRDALLQCRSIQEAHTLLLERERRADSATAEVDFRKYEPRSTANNDDWKLGSDFTPNPSPPERAKISAIPNRYRISNDDHGKVLTCVEAPMVMVRAEPGIAISAKRARTYRAGAIFLDGAAQGEPFVDVKKDLYNLDHPEGCIRSLATCEQAMVLIRKGLDLRKRDWVVLANDADLDTIFAVWVLLNYLRLNADAEVRAKVMPLLRLEGAIDAHGSEWRYFSGFPPDLLHSTAIIRQRVQQQEDILKHYGRWADADLLEYMADRLRAVDQLIYSPESFDGLQVVDELARAEIANGSVAVVCRADAGMDEVERQLEKIYGERLGIVIFENTPSSYKVRLVDSKLPAMIEQAYDRLNLLDPAVTGRSENRWGGSTEIGYSPRKTGTGLMPKQIVEAVRGAFWVPNLFDVVCAIPRAAVLAGAALSPALALIFVGNLLRDRGYLAIEAALLSAVALTLTAGFLLWFTARRVPGLYGWRVPTGLGWVTVLPAALIGAAAGGVWAPGSLAWRIGPDKIFEFSGIAALLLPLGAELLFRGVILGHLAARLPIQKSRGEWRHSWPTLISTLLYAGASLLLFLSFAGGEIHIGQWLLIAGGAVVFGIASGIARERSESVFASVLLHWVCAAALLFFSRLLF
jgi:membrane protease YdiL (CAAX protease family)